MPPTMGAAIGFITSEPTPDSHRIGRDWRERANTRHQFRPQPVYGSFDRRIMNCHVGDGAWGCDSVGAD